jgi:deoxyribose-phosphate aldolase
MITQTINHLIDHTKLDINASPDSLLILAKEAVAYRFNSICIRPAFIKDLAPVYRCSAVISFPENKISYDPEKDKLDELIEKFFLKTERAALLEECEIALRDGALELDPVMNPKYLLNEVPITVNPIYEDLTSIIDKIFDLESLFTNKYENLEDLHICLKPIFSCELLNDEQLKYSVEILARVAHYYKQKKEKLNSSLKINISYKNSTGFIEVKGLEAQANPELIRKIKNLLDLYDKEPFVQIKAAGGIRSYEDAIKIINITNERLSHLGTSKGIQLCETI